MGVIRDSPQFARVGVVRASVAMPRTDTLNN